MRALGIVELQRPGQRLQHELGDAADLAALEAPVVVGADAGQRRDLLAAQAGHPPLAVARQAGLLGRDPRPSGGEELGDVVGGVHADHDGRPSPPPLRGPVGAPLTGPPTTARAQRAQWMDHEHRVHHRPRRGHHRRLVGHRRGHRSRAGRRRLPRRAAGPPRRPHPGAGRRARRRRDRHRGRRHRPRLARRRRRARRGRARRRRRPGQQRRRDAAGAVHLRPARGAAPDGRGQPARRDDRDRGLPRPAPRRRRRPRQHLVGRRPHRPRRQRRLRGDQVGPQRLVGGAAPGAPARRPRDRHRARRRGDRARRPHHPRRDQAGASSSSTRPPRSPPTTSPRSSPSPSRARAACRSTRSSSGPPPRHSDVRDAERRCHDAPSSASALRASAARRSVR